MTESMEKLLKRTRLEKKLTINDVTKDLRIRKDHLVQFEKKIAETLGVYELGYLRSYAKYLGVDVNAYIADLKEKAKTANQEQKEESKNKFFKAATSPATTITVFVSIVALSISVAFLMMLHKKGPKDFQRPAENALVQVAVEKTGFSFEKKSPYEYLVSGNEENIGEPPHNIIARTNTTFTMIDPVQNKVINSGLIRTGEQLSLPKAQGNTGTPLSSIIIKTNVPDVFDAQQDIKENK